MKITTVTDFPYYLTTRAALTMTSILKKEFSDAEIDSIRPAYLGVLISLGEKDGQKLNDLGKMAGLEPSSMTGLIDRMERDELLNRSAAPGDRRAQLIFLTEKGKNIYKPAMKTVIKSLSNAFKNISENEIDQYKNTLRKILGNTR